MSILKSCTLGRHGYLHELFRFSKRWTLWIYMYNFIYICIIIFFMYTYIYVPFSYSSSIFPSVIFNLHHLICLSVAPKTEQLLPRTLINGMRVAAREPWASNLAGGWEFRSFRTDFPTQIMARWVAWNKNGFFHADVVQSHLGIQIFDVISYFSLVDVNAWMIYVFFRLVGWHVIEQLRLS